MADRLNSLPKYVVSSTLEDPNWSNSTILKGDVVHEVSRLKQELDGDIVVVASFQLVRTLMDHFGATSDKKPMRLVDTQTIDGDVAYLTYEPVRDA